MLKVPGTDGPHFTRLKAWADTRGLEVVVTLGSQREPENVVMVRRDGSGTGRATRGLITRSSLDSIETAAFYLLNTLELLGVDVSVSSGGESS